MYELTIEANGKKIVKQAKTKGELRRLVYLYSVGSQRTLDALVEDLSKPKEVKEVKEEKITKTNKKEENGNL